MRQLVAVSCIFFLLIILLYSCGNVKKKQSIAILRQCIGFDSGLKEPEYHLFLTEKDIDDFYRRTYEKLGRHPAAGHPIISDNEMCLFIFMGEKNSSVDAFFADVIEEQDRIVFRVSAPEYSYLYGPIIENPNEPKKVDSIDKPEIIPPKRKTPYGYFVLPKTNKKIVIEEGSRFTIGEGKNKTHWHPKKEFNVK